MKRSVQILVLFLFYLLFSAKSCDQGEQYDAAREQAQIKSTMDSITAAFGSDSLSLTALNAFEETAKYKFSDFLDYINILTDSGTAPEFKVHARLMIRDLFLSEKNVLRLNDHDGNKKGEFILAELISEGSLFRKNLSLSPSDSIWVIDKLHRVNDSLFAGRLGVSYTGSVYAPNHKNFSYTNGTIDFFAVKREKSFGKETLNVWTVLLGDIDFNGR